MDKSHKKEIATEYPYESLYRPWSWILSSFFNIFLLMVLVGIAYFYYRRRKSLKRNFVTYRTVKGKNHVETKGNKKVALVTGGNGRLGSELVRALVDNGGYLVHSLDLLLPEEENRDERVCTYIQADINNQEDISIAFKGVDVVFHCASLVPKSIRFTSSDFHYVNVEGTKNVLNASTECGVKRFIYTSSATVNLCKDPNKISENCDESCPIPSDPLNPYVASKGIADQLVRDANGKKNLQTCVLRLTGLLEFVYEAMEENLVNMKGYHYEFSLVSVASAVQAHLLAEKKLSEGETSVAGKAYNIGEEKTTLLYMIKFIASEKNVSLISIHIVLLRFLARVSEVVYMLTGLVAFSETLNSSNVNMKTRTYVCGCARQQLGWEQGPSWKEVIRELIKKNQKKKTK